MLSGPRLVAWLLAIVIPTTGSALWRVWIRQQTVSLGYRLHQAERQQEALRIELQKAQLARAAGRTPQQVSAMAQALGMAPPQAAQTIAYRPRQVLR